MRVNTQPVLEGISIMFRNFSGKEGRFNAAGKRNFCARLTDDMAAQLENEGWAVKYLEPREEGDRRVPYIKVNVSFGKVPPKLYLVTKGGITALTEETVNMLDYAEIANVDLVLRPYNWDESGTAAPSAYVKSMYVTVVEDPLEEKYANS